MERATWTDQRLDDLAARMDAGFQRVDSDVRELRKELRQELSDGFGGSRTEMNGLRAEMNGLRAEMNGLRTELGGRIDALQVTMLRVGGGMMISLVGVIAAVLARG